MIIGTNVQISAFLPTGVYTASVIPLLSSSLSSFATSIYSKRQRAVLTASNTSSLYIRVLVYVFEWCCLPSIHASMIVSRSHFIAGKNALEKIKHIDIREMSPMVRVLINTPKHLVSMSISLHSIPFLNAAELRLLRLAITAMIIENQSTLRHILLDSEEILGGLLFISIQGCRSLETLILPNELSEDEQSRMDGIYQYAEVLVSLISTCPRLSTLCIENYIISPDDIITFMKSRLKLTELKIRQDSYTYSSVFIISYLLFFCFYF